PGARGTNECCYEHEPHIPLPPWASPSGQAQLRRSGRGEEVAMKQQADRAAGLDVHRDNVVAATRINEPGREVTVTKKKFPTTRRGIGALVVSPTAPAVARS